MKKLFFIILTLCSLTAFAQPSTQKINTCYNTIAVQVCKRALDGQALMGVRGACRDDVIATIQKNSQAWKPLCKQYELQS